MCRCIIYQMIIVLLLGIWGRASRAVYEIFNQVFYFIFVLHSHDLILSQIAEAASKMINRETHQRSTVKWWARWGEKWGGDKYCFLSSCHTSCWMFPFAVQRGLWKWWCACQLPEDRRLLSLLSREESVSMVKRNKSQANSPSPCVCMFLWGGRKYIKFLVS